MATKGLNINAFFTHERAHAKTYAKNASPLSPRPIPLLVGQGAPYSVPQMFGLDPKALLGGDLKDFAKHIQQAAAGGQFNPLEMFTGESHIHSVFLAPLPPQVQEAITEFLDTGAGAFAGLIGQIQAQDPSLDQGAAAQHAREMLQHAQGFCVIVLENDQGLSPLTHLFFGALPDEFIDAFTQSLAAKNLDTIAKTQLQALRDKVSDGQRDVQECFICEDYDEPDEYWLDLAERITESIDEGIMPAALQGLGDLAYWCAGGMAQSNDELDGDELLLHARCAALGNELEASIHSLDAIFEDYEPDEEDIIPVCEQIGTLAVRNGQGMQLESCFLKHQSSVDALFEQSYEMASLRFRLLASSNADAESLLNAAQRMMDIDQKSCRHDLNKEPVWVITCKPNGESLDTADAADLLDRSLQFINKRLESGTLPFYKDNDDTIIPKQALEAWQKVMQTLNLLD